MKILIIIFAFSFLSHCQDFRNFGYQKYLSEAPPYPPGCPVELVGDMFAYGAETGDESEISFIFNDVTASQDVAYCGDWSFKCFVPTGGSYYSVGSDGFSVDSIYASIAVYVPSSVGWLPNTSYYFFSIADNTYTLLADIQFSIDAAGIFKKFIYSTQGTFSLDDFFMSYDTWYHFEIFLRRDLGSGSHCIIWKDGEEIYNAVGTASEELRETFWGLEHNPGGIPSFDAWLYIDQVQVSTQRIGN